jgi:hypothetical protein
MGANGLMAAFRLGEAEFDHIITDLNSLSGR